MTNSERLRITFQLFDDGMDMMKQTLRRRHPAATDQELDKLFHSWLRERPMDAPGEATLFPR